MTKEDCPKLIKPFIDKCDEDGDPFLIVHFSKESDWYNGYHERMDFGDALLVVKNLVKEFGIIPELITK